MRLFITIIWTGQLLVCYLHSEGNLKEKEGSALSSLCSLLSPTSWLFARSILSLHLLSAPLLSYSSKLACLQAFLVPGLFFSLPSPVQGSPLMLWPLNMKVEHWSKSHPPIWYIDFNPWQRSQSCHKPLASSCNGIVGWYLYVLDDCFQCACRAMKNVTLYLLCNKVLLW